MRAELKRRWPLYLILFAFFFMPYSSIDPNVRPGEQYFSMYHRLAVGVNLWELLLVLAFGVLALRGMVSARPRLSLGMPDGALAVLVIFVIAFALGWLHAEGAVLSYGTTEVKRAVIALLPALYLTAVYALVVNYVTEAAAARTVMRALAGLTWLLACYGAVRLFFILQGRVQTMWPFGLPIVLYDQMVMLYPMIFAVPAWALLAAGQEGGFRLKTWHWFGWTLLVFLILSSARRFNYVVLAAGLLLTIAAGVGLRWWRVRDTLRFLSRMGVTLALVAGMAWLALPRFMEGVQLTIATLQLGSVHSNKYGGDLRRAELRNLLANLEQRPYAFLTGMGLGTKWRAREAQPLDNFTYPQAYVSSSRGWFPQFHLPYLALFYRFGMIGCAVLVGWILLYLLRRGRLVCRLHESWTRGLALAFLVYLALHLPNLGDSANPTPAILCGVIMGLLDRLAPPLDAA